MQKINSQNANNILIRLKSALNFDTDAELALFLGIKASTISTWKSRNTVDYKRIFAKCKQSEIDLHWLITGSPFIQNELFHKVEEAELKYKPRRKDSIENQDPIKFVPTTSQVSYLSNYNNPEYIKNLPSINIMDMLVPGSYRAFEITEDSMSTMFIPGDRILGKYMDDYKKIINFHPYAIITEDSIQIRKVVSRIEEGILELHSHNPIYKAYSPTLININEVKELWKWIPPTLRMNLLNDNKDETIQLLQKRVNLLSKKKK